MLALMLIVLCITILVYFLISFPAVYWKKRNVCYIFPIFQFIKTFFNKKDSFCDVFKRMYSEHSKLRYFGSSFFLSPALFICDVNLIKQMLITDSQTFIDHFDFFNGSSDPIFNSSLFSINGLKWKEIRSILSPVFTTKKLKETFVIINQTAKSFVNVLEINNFGKSVIEVNLNEFFGQYTNDIVASYACGIEISSFQDEYNKIFSISKTVLKPNFFQIVKIILYGIFPKFFNIFRIHLFSKKLSKSFLNIIKHTVKNREESNIFRPDLIDFLLEAKKQRTKLEKKFTNHIDINDEMIASQALVFYIAGSGTSSALLQFLSYELALNPEIQQKLYEEIDKVMLNNKNLTVSYEDLLSMKYFDQTVHEALRKWPAPFILNRICNKNYIIHPENANEKQIVIEKGCLVMIPVVGLHNDPKFFPEPEKFKPERFNSENKHKIVAGSYLPFGVGPRNCLGSRFALIQVKTIIFYLLYKYKFVPIERTEIPIRLANRLTIEPRNDLWIGLETRVTVK